MEGSILTLYFSLPDNKCIFFFFDLFKSYDFWCKKVF